LTELVYKFIALERGSRNKQRTRS